MNSLSLGRLTRNVAAAQHLESFFIAAVGSFLGIRWFLALTGYPRIGSHGIHIAHMLWGGLLMLVAVMLLLAFLDRSVEHLAAVVAGLGFGYRPAIALIYGLFVVAFLVARTLIGQRPLGQREAIANALDLLAGKQDRPIEPDDRSEIRRLLDLADPKAALTRLAEQCLAEMPGAAEQERLVTTVGRRFAQGYAELMAKRWAERLLIVGVATYAAAAVAGVMLIATSTPDGAGGENATVARFAQVLSTIAGAALVGVGVVRLRSSRVAAYHWFMHGLLVWILITQMFIFYSSQLAGLGGLIIDLVAYGSLRYALTREIVAGRGPQENVSQDR